MKVLLFSFAVGCSLFFFTENLPAQTDTLSKFPVNSLNSDSSEALKSLNQLRDSCQIFADYVYRLFLIHEYDSILMSCNDCEKEFQSIQSLLIKAWPLKPVCNYQDSANAVSGNSCFFTIDFFDRSTSELKIRIFVYRDTKFPDEIIISRVECDSSKLPDVSNREFQNELKKQFNRQIEYHMQQGRTSSPR